MIVMTVRDVLIVLFDGVQSLDVTGPLEVFAGANTELTGQGEDKPGYLVRTASLDRAVVRCSSGLTLTPDLDLHNARTPHTLVVPGGTGTRTPDAELVAWLRRRAERVPRIMSVCTGAFLLAEAGLLTGRRVTTHWSRCAALARKFPEIDVDAEPIFIRDGRIATSAGVTAGIDLALALVEEDLGRDVALTVARGLVMFLRRPGNQSQFSVQLTAQFAQRKSLRDVQRWIVEHPDAELGVDTLAARANLSPRQFSRVFTQEVGVPPGHYVDQVRLERARGLLEDTKDSVERIARRCGYRTTESMRRAFLRTLDVSPSEYRCRF